MGAAPDRAARVRPRIEPGIYLDLPEDAYHAAEGLSNSGMKCLAISPLQYWHQNLNPNYERPEATPAQRLGTAFHRRLLEPERFGAAYALSSRPEDHAGCLVTMEHLKAFCVENGIPKSAKTKAELVERIVASGLSHPPIWDLIEEMERRAAEGKVAIKFDDARLIEGMAATVEADPHATAMLSDGRAEVSFFVRDPETGVLLKARMDYVRPDETVDLKSFSNSRRKPTDRAVFDAIYHEGYYLQAASYSRVRELARQALLNGELEIHGAADPSWVEGFRTNATPTFGFVFVESDEPFDLRLVRLKRSEVPGAGPNVYWNAAVIRIEEMTALYRDCLDAYGHERWSTPRPPHVLNDTDIPQLMFA